MSRALPFVLSLVALALIGAICVGLAQGASSLADPNPYLSRYGLEAPLVPFHIVDGKAAKKTPLEQTKPDPKISRQGGFSIPIASCVWDGTAPNVDCPTGGSYQLPGVWVRDELGSLWKARTALHEWLHVVSHYHSWCLLDGDEPSSEAYLSRDFVRWYEEGLVEALTLQLLPGYWRDLTGKRIGTETLTMMRWSPSYPEAFRWLRAAEQATGTKRFSRASREWLIARLTSTLDDRVVVLSQHS